MADFEQGLKALLKKEGGYVNNPKDSGGETFMGITRKNYPDNKMWEIVDECKKKTTSVKKLNEMLSADETVQSCVRDIYKKMYWDRMRLDEVFSQKLAEQMFDIAVNMGFSKAIAIVKRIMGTTGSVSKVMDEFIKYGNGEI